MSMKTETLFSLERSLAAPHLAAAEYPWQALAEIGAFILHKGKRLSPEKFYQPKEGVWIAKNARIAESACIMPPAIIDEEAEVRHCAYIRGNVIIGKGAVVGNSTEVKNSIVFDGVQIPHYNYVGDSILGYKSHMGAGSITSNVKSDKTPVTILKDGEKISTGLKKFGAMVGDFTEIGCNTVLCPGTVIGKGCTVYPLSRVRGYLPENSIFKSEDCIVPKTEKGEVV